MNTCYKVIKYIKTYIKRKKAAACLFYVNAKILYTFFITYSFFQLVRYDQMRNLIYIIAK